MSDNPYAPPSASLVSSRPNVRRRVDVAQLVVGAGLVGGLFAGTGYAAVALLVEHYLVPPWLPGETRLSYGQHSGVMCLVAGVLGAGCAASIGLAKSRQLLFGLGVGAAACILTCLLVANMWLDQIALYVRDFSEYVLYWPYVALIPLAITLSLATTFLLLWQERADFTIMLPRSDESEPGG